MEILCLLVCVVTAMMMDLVAYKISNKLIVGGLFAGCFLNVVRNGEKGFLFSVSGILLPIIILWMVYVFRIIGAGDVKLFSVIGGIMGTQFVLKCILYAIFIGGLLAVIKIIKRTLEHSKDSVIPFSIAILAAVMILI